MKILHICMNALFIEGYSYQDNLLTEYQHKQGHDVLIITTTKTRDLQGQVVEIKPEKKVLDNGTTLIRLKKTNKFFSMLGIYPKLNKLITEYQPDMIFIHGLCSYVPKQAIKYKKKYSNVCIVADNHQDLGNTKVREFPFSFVLRLHRWGWKKWISDVARVYGTTSWRKNFARDYYGIPEEKLDVLIMGVDSDKSPQEPAVVRKEIRRQLGIPQDNFVFITGGKLDAKKQVLLVMNSFIKLQSLNARFIIFGSVSKDIEEKFYELLDKDNRIVYLGFIESQEVKKYFCAADFGVFPGSHSVLWEEAIGSGLPALFRRHEKKDHMEVCDNCICIDQADENSILKILEKVVFDESYYRKLLNNAFEAKSKFSYHEIAKKSLECCEIYKR